MNLDYLAYFIILIAVVFMLFPAIGGAACDASEYLDAVWLGFCCCLGIFLLITIPAAIVWAFMHLAVKSMI